LSVGDRTFSLDEFIDTAQFEITPSAIPIPLMILRCWSIVNSVWFCDDHHPVFNFIDMEGTEHTFDIFSNDLDYKLWDQLLLQSYESDSDSDEEQETEVDADADVDTDLDTGAIESICTEPVLTEIPLTGTQQENAADTSAPESLDEPDLPSAPLPPSQPDTDVDEEYVTAVFPHPSDPDTLVVTTTPEVATAVAAAVTAAAAAAAAAAIANAATVAVADVSAIPVIQTTSA